MYKWLAYGYDLGRQQWIGEGRGMREIRIKDCDRNLGYYSCEYRQSPHDNECGETETGRRWELECGDALFNLCERHGRPLIHLIKGCGNHSITITGGYDDEPKSKLASRRDRLVGEITDFNGLKSILLDILDHLIEKERDNDR